MRGYDNGRADTVPKSAIRHILSAINSGEQWEIEQVVKAEIRRVHAHGRQITMLKYERAKQGK